ncbi:NAD(P)/FAD-dependent oxidoreductase [Stenotrophomonas pigmentata]|uniref:NAD(P)/FAD-dependent oxidoreductase n=1 Tax=Stenotrophomonas pigmentata TaxID=3055080 RepID=UPI0026F2B595|nr:FAD-dependent oxidoreductase [Stenotrophomonas sp. 610A2]
MRIAIIGSGIAGLASAWWLDGEHEVTLFEANDYLGGHTHTHALQVGGTQMAVDTGFIVFNPRHYPLLSALFDELEVESQPTTMSFSMRSERSGVEYNATSLDGLFCQHRNLVSPRFWGMLRDLRRFYRDAPALLDGGDGPTLGEYLRSERYGEAFVEEHLLPMASALWSSPTATVREFPARYLVQFMANHHMLQISGRPQWRVVKGGSARYIDAMRARWQVRERLECAVWKVEREPDGARVYSTAGVEGFDEVIMACHSDQALRLLDDADPLEQQVLGAISYQHNEVVLHTDASLLPRNRKAWAAWNAHVPQAADAPCTVSYYMNLLQGIAGDTPLVVTLNNTAQIDPGKVLRRMRYAHPVHDHAAVAAQQRWAEIQGQRHTWFAGAYWGWGFHEDGIRSARRVVDALAERRSNEFWLTQPETTA